MKNYKDFIKETLNVNGANVANFTPFLFSRDEDLLSQDYQTPAEPGEAKWRFSNVYPVMKLELDKASDGPSIDQMVDASKEFVNIEAARTAARIQKTYRQFQGLREENKEDKITKCPEGQYYDRLQKKCVIMPPKYGGRYWGGSYHKHHVNGKNGNGNGNGNGSHNGNGNGNGNGGHGNGGNGNGGGGNGGGGA